MFCTILHSLSTVKSCIAFIFSHRVKANITKNGPISDLIHWERHNTTYVKFLPKSYCLDLATNKPSKKYKLKDFLQNNQTILFKMPHSMVRKAENWFLYKETKETLWQCWVLDQKLQLAKGSYWNRWWNLNMDCVLENSTPSMLNLLVWLGLWFCKKMTLFLGMEDHNICNITTFKWFSKNYMCELFWGLKFFELKSFFKNLVRSEKLKIKGRYFLIHFLDHLYLYCQTCHFCHPQASTLNVSDWNEPEPIWFSQSEMAETAERAKREPQSSEVASPTKVWTLSYTR